MNQYKRFLTTALLLSLSLALGLSGCKNETEMLFDKPSIERTLDFAEECEQTLLAAPGWQMEYKVPHRDFEEIFTLQLKFEAGKKVTIWSDFLPEPVTSSYALSMVSGPVITFDTPGALTELANPANTPSKSKEMHGYYGENNFVIMSHSPEKVVLRGLVYGGTPETDIVLTPLSAGPGLSVDESKELMLRHAAYNLRRFGSAVSLMEGDKEVAEVAFDLPSIGKYIPTEHIEVFKYSMIVFDPSGDESKDREYALTPGGQGDRFTLTPALEYNGQTIKELVFDEAGKALRSPDESTVWINLQTKDPIVDMLTDPKGYYATGFYLVDASPILKKLLAKETIAKIYPNFTTLQWYNMPKIKSFSYLHKDAEGNSQWPGFSFKLHVVDPGAAIFLLEATGIDKTEQSITEAALADQGLNGVNTVAIFFTSLGGKTSTVKISEIDPQKGIIRITSTQQDILWLDFQRFGD